MKKHTFFFNFEFVFTQKEFSIILIGILFPYTVFIVSRFVALVVHVVMFFLQIKLHPVMQTHDLLTVLGFSHKDMFKATGILPVMQQKQICTGPYIYTHRQTDIIIINDYSYKQG